MKTCKLVLGSLMFVLVLVTSVESAIPSVKAIGVANVVVNSVYWGSNPLDPSNAHPGDVNVPLSIVLSNVGDDSARDVKANLSIGPPLTYTYYEGDARYAGSSISKTAGDIGPGMSFTVSYVLSVDSNAKEGVYRYKLLLSYKTARELQEVTNPITVDIPVWKSDLRIQNVITLPPKIYPDNKQVQVKVSIINSGKGTAQDLRLQMEVKKPFQASSSGSDKYFVGNLPAGQLSEVDFMVDVDKDAKFGRYPVALSIETGEKPMPIGEVQLFINEKVQFEVVKVTPTDFQAGDSGKVVRVELRNTGSIKADSVRAQLRVGNFFSGTLTDFLGTILEGEVKVAFFTVDVDARAQSGVYNFDLRIDWTQDNNALDDTLRVPMNVRPPGAPVMLLVLGVIILVGVVYVGVRKGKIKIALPLRKKK